MKRKLNLSRINAAILLKSDKNVSLSIVISLYELFVIHFINFYFFFVINVMLTFF